jgi:hypothetical protein
MSFYQILLSTVSGETPSVTYFFQSCEKENAIIIGLDEMMLDKYPGALLYTICHTSFRSEQDPKKDIYVLSCPAQFLKMIESFYKHKENKWPNPYISENKFIFRDKDTLMVKTFEEACEYMGLPSDKIEDIQEDEEQDECDEYQEDDFVPVAATDLDDPFGDGEEEDLYYISRPRDMIDFFKNKKLIFGVN